MQKNKSKAGSDVASKPAAERDDSSDDSDNEDDAILNSAIAAASSSPASSSDSTPIPKQFELFEEAVEAIRKSAKEKGFTVHLSTTRKNVAGVKTGQDVCCSCKGPPESSSKNIRKSSTQRTGCKWHVKISLSEPQRSAGVWRVSESLSAHNHDMLSPELVALMPQNRHIPAEIEEHVEEVCRQAYDMSPTMVADMLRVQFPQYHEDAPSWSHKDLSNLLNKKRRELKAKLEAQHAESGGGAEEHTLSVLAASSSSSDAAPDALSASVEVDAPPSPEVRNFKKMKYNKKGAVRAEPTVAAATAATAPVAVPAAAALPVIDAEFEIIPAVRGSGGVAEEEEVQAQTAQPTKKSLKVTRSSSRFLEV